MNIEQIFESIQSFRTQLDQWGITGESLIAIAVVAGVLFMLSLREVLVWFVKVQHLRDDVRELRGEIQLLRSALEKTTAAQAESLPAPTGGGIETVAKEIVKVSKKETVKPLKKEAAVEQTATVTPITVDESVGVETAGAPAATSAVKEAAAAAKRFSLDH